MADIDRRRGRIVNCANPGRSETDFVYDAGGRLVTESLVGGISRNFVYDKVGQIVSMLEFNGAGTLAERWTYLG